MNFSMSLLSQSSSLPLFSGNTHTKNAEWLLLSGSLSYTWMWELFLVKWKELGFDSSQFGLHSLRAGGATSAANAGVPDRLLNAMAIGGLSQPKMAPLKIHMRHSCQSPRG